MATGRSLNNTFKILNSYALISRSEHDISPHASTSSQASSHRLTDDLDIIRIHSVVQDFFIDSMRAAGTRATWLAHATALFVRSYTQATQRIQAKTNAGLVGDYRSYEIHAKRLLSHLARIERKGPALPAIREQLEVTLQDIMAEIVRRTRESSLDIAKGGSDEAFMLSIFDRTSSSSDTGPETPGPADSYPPGAHLWGMETQLDSPVSVNDFPLKFPAMPEVDDGYDSDWSSNASASVIMRGSHYSIGPGIATPTNNNTTITPIYGSPTPMKEEWTVVPPKRPHTTVPRTTVPRADLHRTTRALEASRYHDSTGASQNTWTAKNGVFWPSQLLPVTLRQAKARVLVYGYNADVYTFGSDKSASSDMIHQHAQSLLTGLSMERMSEEKEENAIIWVAHSLGGILVKRVSLSIGPQGIYL